jgi:hypothetical protein
MNVVSHPIGKFTLRSQVALARFVGRALALLGIVFVLTFLFAEGFPTFWGEPYYVQVELVGAAVMVAGLMAGFLWELTGAALIAGGWLAFAAFHGNWPPWPFTVFLVVAAFYTYCGCAARRLM